MFEGTPFLPEGKWNLVNEPDPDSLVSAVVQSRWLGLLGKRWFATERDANIASDTATGTLHGGWYALVQTKSGSSTAPAKGIPAFFDTSANSGLQNSVVTPDAAAAIEGFFAGVYLSAPTKG